MAEGGHAEGSEWEVTLGREDQRHHRVMEKVKEAYEEVASGECRDLAYDCQVPFLRMSTFPLFGLFLVF